MDLGGIKKSNAATRFPQDQPQFCARNQTFHAPLSCQSVDDRQQSLPCFEQESALEEFIRVNVVNVGLLAFVGYNKGYACLGKHVRVEASLHRESDTEEAESA